VRLAIVTHSIMITSQILKQNKYISNNYGFQANFTFDPETQKITQVCNASGNTIDRTSSQEQGINFKKAEQIEALKLRKVHHLR
jgi:hypothetical protein